ncbi:ATP-grasp domain-containing protein [Bradyrhizobium sp. 146]|nr:ATP-grasp domain-containing protein [Bradyrhizobium sp. 146]
MRIPFVPRLLARIADQAGVRVELEPEFEFAGRMIFPNGNFHLFRAGNLNINRAGSVAIAEDKNYTSYFLHQSGLKVPRELTFFSDYLSQNLAPERRRSIKHACEFAAAIGYPVVVKPNDGSLGAFVVKAHGPEDIASAAERIFTKHHVAIVQEFCTGNDYRVVVLGDQIISAYQRIPLHVVGDGRSTIDELIVRKKDGLAALGRPNTEIDPSDVRVDAVLARHGLSRVTILPDGKIQRLLDNANLSAGGDAVDITSRLDASFADIAVNATRALGLSLCGVDIVCEDATRPADDYTILELNAAPGLDNYASVGEEQSRRVDEMFLKIMKFLEKSSA